MAHTKWVYLDMKHFCWSQLEILTEDDAKLLINLIFLKPREKILVTSQLVKQCSIIIFAKSHTFREFSMAEYLELNRSKSYRLNWFSLPGLFPSGFPPFVSRTRLCSLTTLLSDVCSITSVKLVFRIL